jgi:hypothetical protein
MKKVFISVAVYKCSCCNYKSEVYSDQEWLDENWTEKCKVCNSTGNKTFDFGIVYRPDVCKEVVLHPQCAYLPKHLDCCVNCSKRDKIHWTELLVSCPSCESGHRLGFETMVFSHYVKGRHFDAFSKIALDNSKPSHPPMIIIDKNGHRLWVLGSGFTSN